MTEVANLFNSSNQDAEQAEMLRELSKEHEQKAFIKLAETRGIIFGETPVISPTGVKGVLRLIFQGKRYSQHYQIGFFCIKKDGFPSRMRSQKDEPDYSDLKHMQKYHLRTEGIGFNSFIDINTDTKYTRAEVAELYFGAYLDEFTVVKENEECE